ncbi:hypothetical protein BRADI_4g13665v3 [Brachypodium distachyon]|uniref:Uncharacterized protein n=1 Tax=Brachypodium distachyon TaxID=15368 RepID=A0A2K2CMM5_BRADI|nr:hypothetical protein BRADI_4g13665v3 [Brachypodium distachyon]
MAKRHQNDKLRSRDTLLQHLGKFFWNGYCASRLLKSVKSCRRNKLQKIFSYQQLLKHLSEKEPEALAGT